MNDIVIINLPDNEDEALNFLLSHNDCNKVKIIGKLRNWHYSINDWINKNEITYLDLYELDEIVEWNYPDEDGDPIVGGIFYCESVQEVVHPKNLISMPSINIMGCNNLHTIHIPASLSRITCFPDYDAFNPKSIKKIFLELSENNSWILSGYYFLDIHCILKDGNFEEINGVWYDKKNYKLLKLSKEFKGDYAFPSDIKSVADFAFSNTNVDKIVIPGNLVEISMAAFNDATIETITFEEGIENIHSAYRSKHFHGPYSTGKAFSHGQVKNIILPSTLKEIGNELFARVTGLEKVAFLNESPIFEIENGIIYNKLLRCTVASIPNKTNEYVVKEGTTIIGKHTFSREFIQNRNGKFSIILPKSIENIEELAFFNCDLESIELPENLMNIGKYAFAWSRLTNILIPDGVKIIAEGAFYMCGLLSQIKLSSSIEMIDDWTFSSCSSLKNIDIPVNVTEINDQSFQDCENLNEIFLPQGLKRIKVSAFWCCKSLETVTFPEGLEEIHSNAFEECTNLKRIILPDSINYLGYRAFKGCIALESINIPANCEIHVPEDEIDDDNQFDGCHALINITVANDNPYHTISEGVLYNKQGDYLIKSFSNKKIVKILERVQTIGPKSFADTGCEEVLMSENVKEIGLMAFSNCTNLKHVRFSRNINEIDITQFWVGKEGPFGGIFDKCTNLSKITNVSIETLQKFPEVFKSISGATVSVEKEKTIESKTDNSNTDKPVIAQDVLDAINSNYFVDPVDVIRLVKLIIVHKDEELVKRESIYLNNARHLLEHVRTSIQNIGIIPLRCSALKTGLRILGNSSWPVEIVPKEIINKIMKMCEICDSGSHSKVKKYRFNDYGYTNTQIIDFILALIHYVKYITDFSIREKFDKEFYEVRYHKCLYGNYLPDETSNITVGYVQSYVRKNRKTEESERIIEVIHRDNSWSKVAIYEDVLREYYRKTGIEVEEDHKVRVRLVERRNHENNPIWIAKEVIEIVKKPSLLNKQRLI